MGYSVLNCKTHYFKCAEGSELLMIFPLSFSDFYVTTGE